MRTRTSSLGLLAAVTVIIGGCGSGDEKTSPTASATTSATSTEAAPPSAADQAVADGSLLRLADLPPNWTQDDSKEKDQEDPPCKEIKRAKAAVSARASTPDFSMGQATVSQVAYVYADSAAASRWAASLNQ